MRLIEAIVNANHLALAGDAKAGLHVTDYADSLPLIALTCIDPRLNRFFPGVLGLPEEQFIWLRNAGNILTGPLSSTMRSLALACAIKGGREIAIIGHSDCGVRKTTVATLTDRLKALGIDRHQLPENLAEFFGVFASERQNVIRSVDFVRSSPIIGPKIPVHGLLVDTESGKLEWVVNGYEALVRPGAKAIAGIQMPDIGGLAGAFAEQAAFKLGEMKFPESKIGEVVAFPGEWASQLKAAVHPVATTPAPVASAPPPIAGPIPVPPRIPDKIRMRMKK